MDDHLTVERQSLAMARHQPYWLDVEVLDRAVITQPMLDNITTLVAAANLYRDDFGAGWKRRIVGC
ncbi:MAG TPA: hypothetical protein P5121_18310 [Caldilineaceae bacterium]|nr:hypothetical protein [Caldilineaceae bacterium]HRW07066.1 hypothetical protein [Caldilineaceae bacterium]